MRIIDADALFEHKVTGEIGNLSGDFVPGYAIGQAPTISAVEVVRCRECKHYRPYEDEECGGYRGKCTFLVGLEGCMYETDYCSYGERREPDGDKTNNLP